MSYLSKFKKIYRYMKQHKDSYILNTYQIRTNQQGERLYIEKNYLIDNKKVIYKLNNTVREMIGHYIKISKIISNEEIVLKLKGWLKNDKKKS